MAYDLVNSSSMLASSLAIGGRLSQRFAKMESQGPEFSTFSTWHPFSFSKTISCLFCVAFRYLLLFLFYPTFLLSSPPFFFSFTRIGEFFAKLPQTKLFQVIKVSLPHGLPFFRNQNAVQHARSNIVQLLTLDLCRSFSGWRTSYCLSVRGFFGSKSLVM